MPAARADRCSASSRLSPDEVPSAKPSLDSTAAFCTWVTRLVRSSTSQSRWLSVIVVRCSGCSVACMFTGYPPPAGSRGGGGGGGGGGGLPWPCSPPFSDRPSRQPCRKADITLRAFSGERG